MEILDDFIRFHRVVLMAFVHNDDKMQTGVQSVFNMLQEVGVFAVFQSVVALFRQLFPVDETVIIFFKSARHYIGEQFCLSGMDILIHLFLALLLQIALAGGEPYKHGITVGLHILVHKIGKNNRLSATRRTF